MSNHDNIVHANIDDKYLFVSQLRIQNKIINSSRISKNRKSFILNQNVINLLYPRRQGAERKTTLMTINFLWKQKDCTLIQIRSIYITL